MGTTKESSLLIKILDTSFLQPCPTPLRTFVLPKGIFGGPITPQNNRTSTPSIWSEVIKITSVTPSTGENEILGNKRRKMWYPTLYRHGFVLEPRETLMTVVVESFINSISKKTNVLLPRYKHSNFCS